MLRRASFEEARLGRAIFKEADLDGGFVFKAGLQGATLDGAKLGGATRAKARLEGATLDKVDALGANFEGADLRGARLRGMQLQSASFKGAQLHGACLENAQLAGADFSDARLDLAQLTQPSLNVPQNVDYEKLRVRLAGNTDALKRFDNLLSPTRLASSFKPLPSTLDKTSQRDIDAEQKALANLLASLVCTARDEDVSSIVHGFIRDDNAGSIIRETGYKARDVIDQILSPNCPASAYLTSKDKKALAD
jgi:hypothetical protein